MYQHYTPHKQNLSLLRSDHFKHTRSLKPMIKEHVKSDEPIKKQLTPALKFRLITSHHEKLS